MLTGNSARRACSCTPCSRHPTRFWRRLFRSGAATSIAPTAMNTIRLPAPVPLETMLRRIDRLADLGTTIVTLSWGEPTLHPDLDVIIRRIRERGARSATVITNGLLLTPERIRALNRAGLDYLQISIDNVTPDDVSEKEPARARPAEAGMARALRRFRSYP